jgi:aryl-alcohol dehydrogenase-like predicted oxidoreductase
MNECLNGGRLVLGGAQLGFDYGIANRSGTPPFRVAEDIIRTAWEGGIREVDTAQGYGSSEQTIGRAIESLGIQNQIRIITKLDTRIDPLDAGAINRAVENSLRQLRIPKLFGLLIHREELLERWASGLGNILAQMVQDGYVEKIGISVYSPESAVDALSTEGLTLIQIPSNLLDRRFEASAVFDTAQRRSKGVYVRSVFLQGLLTMTPGELPRHMQFARKTLEQFRSFFAAYHLDPRLLALGYVRDAYPGAKVLFGAETPEQVSINLDYWQTPLPKAVIDAVADVFSRVDPVLLNPALWPPGPRRLKETKRGEDENRRSLLSDRKPHLPAGSPRRRR